MSCVLITNRRKLAAMFAAALFAAPTAIPVTTAYAVTQSDVDAARSQLESAESACEQKAGQLADTDAKITELDERISENESAVSENESRISEIETKVDDEQDALSKVMRADYKNGGRQGLLSMVLSADSLDDFMTRANAATRVSSAMSEKVSLLCSQRDELVERRDELTKRRRELDGQHEELAELAQRQATEKEQLDKAKAEAQENYDSLSEELKRQLDADEAARQQALAARYATTSVPKYSADGSDELPGTGGWRPKVVNAALSMNGGSYVWGAENPGGRTFDCSGLTKWCYAQVGVSLSHYSESQRVEARCTRPISEAQPGDLVWRSGHVGIYLGNGVTMEAHSPRTGIGYGSVSNFTYCGNPFGE